MVMAMMRRALETDVPRDPFVVCRHHPDRVRQPAPAAQTDALHSAVIWNVFRTLELLPPAFWLRRLQARLAGLSAPGPAPQLVHVALWRPLSLPPARQLVVPGEPEPVADVLIETEHAVCALMLVASGGGRWSEADRALDASLARLIAAGAWFAGTRDFHGGLIAATPARLPLATALVQRYGRSRDSAELQSGPKSVVANVRGVGMIGWADAAAILDDCVNARVLDGMERALARRALRWLADVGIVPLPEPSAVPSHPRTTTWQDD